MDRRAFLRRGLTGGAVAAVAVTASGGTALADHVREDHRREGAEMARPFHGDVSITWSVPTVRKAVALTFDDGPHPRLTPRVLDALQGHGVVATFFLVGQAAHRHPDLVRRIQEEGHEIGNHTWSHPREADVSGADVAADIERGAAALQALTGSVPRWFRSPRGIITGSIVRAAAGLGEQVAMWSVEPHELADPTPAAIARHLQGHLAPGAIYLCHDGTDGRDDRHGLERAHARTIEALVPFLVGAGQMGYQFETLSQLADAAASEPSPGA